MDKKSPLSIHRGPFSIKANKLVMKDKTGLQVAWYWFSTGDDFTHNYYLQQSRFVLNRLLRRSSNDGLLIRVSARTENGNLTQIEEQAKDFISKLTILLTQTH